MQFDVGIPDVISLERELRKDTRNVGIRMLGSFLSIHLDLARGQKPPQISIIPEAGMRISISLPSAAVKNERSSSVRKRVRTVI